MRGYYDESMGEDGAPKGEYRMRDHDAIERIVRDVVRSELAPLLALFEEFEPVIRAYIGPDASGPLAWAVRKRQKK